MPRPTLEIRYVAITAKPIYTCHSCGAREYGQTVRKDFSSTEDVDIPARLAAEVRVLSNNHMPFGWSGRGLDTHWCATCTANGSAR